MRKFSQMAAFATLVLDFGSAEHLNRYFDSQTSTGLWNVTSGKLQGTVAPSGTGAAAVNFGDGSDGVFNDGPTQDGVTISGAIITFDTAVKSVFEFTSFSLSAGNQLRAVGDQPLVIRVLGTTLIDGDIFADGTNGSTNDTSSSPKSGGAGRASGGSGGASASWSAGPVGVVAASGSQATLASSSNPTAGGGPGEIVIASNDSQGGGGGCNGLGPDPQDAENGADAGGGTAGNAATCTSDRTTIAAAFESVFTGGGGGGGGGAYISGANTIAGAGGGAGGGAIRIASYGSITLNGNIWAQGGAGGAYNSVSPNNTDCGGGGGGGAGGSVWVQTAGSFNGATGGIEVSPGGGGDSTAPGCGSESAGGSGSRGVIRVDTSNGTFVPFPSPLGTADAAYGMSVPVGQTQLIYSKPMDFSTRFTSFLPPTATFEGCVNSALPITGTHDLVFEGSRDGVNFEHPVSAANIAELNDYLYIRFKASFTNQAPGTNPPCLIALSIPYEDRELDEITMKGGLFCGRLDSNRWKNGREEGGPQPPAPLSALGDLLLLALACLIARATPRLAVSRILR